MGRLVLVPGTCFVMLAMCVSCGQTSLPGPVLDRVEPPTRHNGAPQQVTIQGENFLVKVTRDLGAGQEITVDDRFCAVLSLAGDGAEEPIELHEVEYLDAGTIEAVVPRDIPVGHYRLTLTDPYGRQATLEDAYTATDELPPSVVDVRPGAVVNDENTAIVVEGARFVPGDDLALMLDEIPMDVTEADAQSIWSVVPAGFAEGSYTVTVRNPDGQEDSLDDGVAVFAPAQLEVVLLLSAERVIPGNSVELQLVASNTGGSPALDLEPFVQIRVGSGLVELTSSTQPPARDLAPGGQLAFSWSYRALEAGVVRFEGWVEGTNQYSLRGFVSDPVDSPELVIVDCLEDDHCLDDDPCTTSERCEQGVCLPGERDKDADGDGHVDQACGGDDCDDTTGAIHPGAAEVCDDGRDNDCDGATDDQDLTCRECVDDADCDDNDACNGVERCENGNCQDGIAPDCDDDNACTEDGCVPASGCSHTPLTAGTSCGVCLACDDQGTCLPVPEGTPCAGTDGDWCTSACDAGGACIDTGPRDCDDDNVCTLDSCNEEDGSCLNITRADGASCPGPGDNWCDASCQAGVCVDGVPAAAGEPCDDSVACTGPDVCDGVGNCLGTPQDGFCDDLQPGDLCRPACFGGASGCGTPPAGMVLACAPDPVDLDLTDSSTCTITLGMSGQLGCLACELEAGSQDGIVLDPLQQQDGGGYTFVVRSETGTNALAAIHCSWDAPPAGREVEDRATVAFVHGGTLNLLLQANGGVIESFTSEYCDPADLPGNCQAGYWEHTNIHDGEHAHGYNADAFRASWASGYKGNQDPEEFLFSFAGGQSGWITEVVVQNYGEQGGAGPYYATHFILYAEPPGGGAWVVLLDEDLPVALPGSIDENEAPRSYDIAALHGGPVEAQRLRLVITDSVASDYWELGELEAWGWLD